MGHPVFFAIPGDLHLPTGGYGYDRMVLEHLPRQNIDIQYLALPGGYPAPDSTTLALSLERIRSLPDDAIILIDGLAYGAMPAAIIRQFGHKIVNLCHHPLCLEAGIRLEDASQLRDSETTAFALADEIIVTSPLTGNILVSDFGVPAEKVTVALPGTTRMARSVGSGSAQTRLMAVGSVIPRKAYDVLVTALSSLTAFDWHLDVYGSLTLEPDTVAELVKHITDNNLSDRITLHGAKDQTILNAAYAKTDVFVMPSLFEGYGMALSEAMIRGLPIVSSTGGALEKTLPDGTGLKVPPGDAAALSEALASLISDSARRQHFADQSWRAGLALPDWTETAARIAAPLKRIGA